MNFTYCSVDFQISTSDVSNVKNKNGIRLMEENVPIEESQVVGHRCRIENVDGAMHSTSFALNRSEIGIVVSAVDDLF